MKLLTLARDLRRRKARETERQFAAEGVRAVEELLRSGLGIRGALVAPQLGDAPRGAALLGTLRTTGVEVAEVTASEFASAAQTDSPQGVIALADIPSPALPEVPLAATARLVILDAVQDPGNVGTVLRTSFALGVTAVVALPGTVDLWNAKVVRSAMGANFHFPVLTATWDQLDDYRGGHALRLWGADAAGVPIDELDPPPRLALLVGNEGGGMTEESRSRLDATVALRMQANAESLNVAVATGILLYQLRP